MEMPPDSRTRRSSRDPLYIDKLGNNRLHVAVIIDAYRTFVSLISGTFHGKRVLMQNFEGSTALHLAVSYKRVKMIRSLLIADTRLYDMYDKRGYKPFHVACSMGWAPGLLELTGTILYSEVNELNARAQRTFTKPNWRGATNPVTQDGDYGMHVAAREGNLNVINYLERQSIDINQPSDHKQATPLHYAVEANQKCCVFFLLREKNIDPDARTKCGITPYQIASYLGLSEILEHLDNAGATPLMPPPGMTREQILASERRIKREFGPEFPTVDLVDSSSEE